MDESSQNATNEQQQGGETHWSVAETEPQIKIVFGKARSAAASTIHWLHERNGLVNAIGTVIIAIFTVVLAIATIDLRDLGEKQANDIKKSIAAAEDSAKAAQDSASAAIAANKLSRDNFIATQRPWITIEVKPGGPLVYNVNGANITLRFYLKNIGHSPAKHVSLNPQVLAPAIGIDKVFDERGVQRQMIEERKNSPFDPHGYLIFPDQTVIQDFTVTISADELKRITQKVDFIFPYIIGSVDYGFVFEDGHHQTGFISHVRRSDQPHRVSVAKKRSPDAIFPDEGDIPTADLRLYHAPFGGGYAD
jgi:hypothetical protein